jgi:hypothetical protein
MILRDKGIFIVCGGYIFFAIKEDWQKLFLQLSSGSLIDQ